MKFVSLRWKISGILILSNIVLGAIIVFIVYRTVTESLKMELIARGTAIAKDLSHYSGELILEEDKIGLTEIITRVISFETAQYILVQNSDGTIIGDTYNGNVPAVLQQRELNIEKTEYLPEIVLFEDTGDECYDIVVPVAEGSLGYIRIGMKRSYIVQRVQETTNYILLSVLIITLIGIIIVYFLANKIINPILNLANRANEISRGKLEDKINITTNDEINYMAEAVERLRESLNMALARLDKSKSGRI
ncbi:MAG: HAMP domain-containing protein [Calditrichales bacterium]|nr:MAG: HAMP domain-containing protein [Calditrichales bacterium]